MRLVDRDYTIMREIDRWRFCLGRHIKYLADFSGQRATDRRLKLLIEAGYINRKKILYGVPSLYYLTYSGKTLLSLNPRQDKIRVEQIIHDIAVLDTAIYFNLKHGIPFSDMTTEKQLHSKDGFGTRKHRPDFIFSLDKKSYCVEVELTQKAKARLQKNIKDNFIEYDYQKWVVPNSQVKIIQILHDSNNQYSNIDIIDLEEVISYVNQFNKPE